MAKSKSERHMRRGVLGPPRRFRGGPMLLALTLCVLPACSSSDQTPGLTEAQAHLERAAMSATDARLGDAFVAFTVGPQNSEMYTPIGEVRQPGFLVLVDPDGSIRTVRTERMDLMWPAWTDTGLYFADESHDFVLTDSRLSIADSPKHTAQNLMLSLDDGNAVGIYNGGYNQDGTYDNQVVSAAGPKVAAYNVEGNYLSGATCGDSIFGLTNDVWPSASGGAANTSGQIPSRSLIDPTEQPQTLARLYPKTGKGEEQIAWRPNFGTGTATGVLPCRDDKLVFLSWDVRADGTEAPAVVSWDTRSGQYTAVQLELPQGSGASFGSFGNIVQQLEDNQLQWVFEGRVLSTDIATGQTRTLFDTGVVGDPQSPAEGYFGLKDDLLRAIVTTPGADGNLVYEEWSISSGTLQKEVTIDIPNQGVNVSNLGFSHVVFK